MNDEPTVAPAVAFPFTYHSIRRISAPEDVSNGRAVYVGCAPATSFLDLPEDENVREYLLEARGRRRQRPSNVHLAIRETLNNNPENFSILNGGITIVARRVTVDDQSKTAYLTQPSIINGSQTRGELKRYIEGRYEDGEDAFPVHVSYEIVETDDEGLIAEISIARNFQNRVMPLSIVGRRGQLEELFAHFSKHNPDLRLQQSETELSEDYVKTEKLLQVITALMPAELWHKPGEQDNPTKTYTYSAKASCLKDFQEFWKQAHAKDATEQQRERYQFFLDICGQAWDIYQEWKTHQGFKGSGLRALKRDEAGNILDVPDGIVFPIIASLSALVVKRNGRWTVDKLDSFLERELIKAAKQVYMEIARSDPQVMGKSKACYSSLYQITTMYRRLAVR